jgi:TRAP-type C4-dicarboxylate transport system permease small subunit
VDKVIYDGETAIAIGSLYVMTIAFVLTVLHSNMKRGVNTFDKFLIGIAGYESEQAIPPDALASITDLWTPLVLSTLTFLLALLAVRTRENVGRTPDDPPLKVHWGKRLGWSAVITAGMYGMLKTTELVPTGYLVAAALVALGVGVVRYRDRVPIGSMVTGGIAAAAMTYYFLTEPNWSHSSISLVLMIYVGFLGASMATRDNRHIRVDAVRANLKGKGFHLYNAVGNVVTAAFTGLFGYLALTFISPGERHGKSDLPMELIVVPIAIAWALMTIRFFVQSTRCFASYRRGEVAPAPELELH